MITEGRLNACIDQTGANPFCKTVRYYFCPSRGLVFFSKCVQPVIPPHLHYVARIFFSCTEGLLIFEGNSDALESWDRGIEAVCSEVRLK